MEQYLLSCEFALIAFDKGKEDFERIIIEPAPSFLVIPEMRPPASYLALERRVAEARVKLTAV